MSTPVFGIIAPHPPIMVRGVGGSRAETTRDSLDALSRAAKALSAFDPQTVVIMSPHAPSLADGFAVDDSAALSGSLAEFGDSTRYEWAGDPSFAQALAEETRARGLAAVARSSDSRLQAGWLDHSTIVPLSFLDPTRARSIVVLSLSYLPYASHRAHGEAVRAAADKAGRRVAFVASGDLSHRLTRDAPSGYSPRAEELDAAIVDCVRRGSLSDLMRIDESLVQEGGECGLRSFVALGGFAGSDPVPTQVLSYEGPWGVGYLTALVGGAAIGTSSDHTGATSVRGGKGGMPGQDESQIVSLARRVIEGYVAGPGPLPSPKLEDIAYPQRAGVFVTLHREGGLRGCIGTILPTLPTLAEEVAANAVQAASRDPRFSPVGPGELADLDISVDVLHSPEPCSAAQLDPAHYGVIVSNGRRRGLLLPDLEGVDDAETQIGIALRKAGIGAGERYDLERFRVDRYT